MKVAAPRVFRHRNYRIFFAGQFTSLTGTWIRTVALGWLAYRLTGSPFLLGIVTFAAHGPLFFVAPFTGAIADRMDRRKVFIVTQALFMLQMAVLTVLTFAELITPELLVAIALFGGIVAAVETPTRQAFTIEMVGREDLRQAIAFNAMMFNMARTVGPALGGIIVAAMGEAWCFLLNTFTYAAVIASLLAMHLEGRRAVPETRPWEDLKRGFSYVTHHAEIRTAILLSATTGFFGMSFLAILPAYVHDVLQEGSDAFGFTMAAFGIGATLGAAAASRLPERHITLTPSVAAGGFGLALFVFANVATLPLAIALIFPTGLSWMMLAVTNNSQIQLRSDDAMRGRVMSFYAMGALGAQPLGALLLGYIAGRFGVPDAIMLGAAACVLAAVLSYLNLRRLRPPAEGNGG